MASRDETSCLATVPQQLSAFRKSKNHILLIKSMILITTVQTHTREMHAEHEARAANNQHKGVVGESLGVSKRLDPAFRPDSYRMFGAD